MKRTIFLSILLLFIFVSASVWYNWGNISTMSWDKNVLILVVSAIIALITYFVVLYLQSVNTADKKERWVRLGIMMIMVLIVFFLRGASISLGELFNNLIVNTNNLLNECIGLEYESWYCQYNIFEYSRFVIFGIAILLAFVLSFIVFWISKKTINNSDMKVRFVILFHSFLLLSLIDMFINTFQNKQSLIFVNVFCYFCAIFILFTSESKEGSTTPVVPAITYKKEEKKVETKKKVSKNKDIKKDNENKKDSTKKEYPWSVG